jgi:hypothetical protein
MAIAPQNIMTTLRSMGDAELAKYAQMHQQDPYIFPLAFQESQNRQHLRSAKQAEMAGQQQPKVVQQDLSQMAQMAAPQMPPQAAQPQQHQLPEDQGIAQLPAQNLQKLAGGGIIAFEEGGYVPRYAGTTDGSFIQEADIQARRTRGYGLTATEKSTLVETERRKAEQRAAGAAAAEAGVPYDPDAPVVAQKSTSADAAKYNSYKPNIAQQDTNAFSAPGTYAEYKKGEALPQAGQTLYTTDKEGNELVTTRNPGMSDKDWAKLVAANGGLNMTPTGNVAGSRRTPEQLAAAGVNPNVGKTGETTGDTQAPAPRPQGGLPTLASEMDSYVKAAAKLAPKEPDETNEQYMARKEKAVGPSPIEGQKERLNKQEESAKGDKADALNMALIKAGLGMMAGTSQHALANIGEGAKGGLADYNEAMKDLKKAAIERDKSRDALETAAYAYKRGDFDEFEKQKEKSKDRTAQYNAHVASAMGTIKGQEVSGKYHLAAAGMPSGQERLYATLGGGDVTKGAKLLAEIQAGKRSIAQSYEDYMKAWAGKDTTMGQPLTPQQYANQIKQLNAAMAPPPSPNAKPTGQVLP